ncbi:hypothetical protein DP939_33085 [Spongiactinospora rosea]|uniref:FAD-binding domain-containing protein n=1 Tax=Spongiactinospora rosea TaxID=2248750 RepID=A0A366LPU5_9ACTN|nr:FAD-dependent monooxygenase [Spongiactinospora rosea]RBQ15847.1 hypothetical protein DP939_33085 [Spongiactinospora rosea]
MTDHDVVIAGAGPTGLMLARELRLAGVEAVVLESRTEPTAESRAGGMHARTLEILDQRGILGPFLAEGRRLQGGHFAELPLDFTGLATRHPYLLQLLQYQSESLLEAHAADLGVQVQRGRTITATRQDADGVEVDVRDGDGATETIRARYLVGCDGGRSTVRQSQGIGFPGTGATLTAMLGDVVLTDPPPGRFTLERRDNGSYWVLAFEPGWHRVITYDYSHVADRSAPCTLEDLRASMTKIAGTDFGMHAPRWISWFGDTARQAERYRRGRVLLAGDAAHVHFPAGGQGLNTGVQDAVNLGWKLAAVVNGHASPDLLDTYQTERHPVAARVLQNTRAQTRLSAPGWQAEALRETMARLIELAPVNDELSNMIAALDIRYEMGVGDHPLLGLRMPDVDLQAPGPTRSYALLHAARPVLLDLGSDAGLSALTQDRAGRVDTVTARCAQDRWTVPLLGEVEAPEAVLIRPDGHIAWAAPRGRADTDALRDALAKWCG